MLRVLKLLLSPLIWIKQAPSKVTEILTHKLANKTGAAGPNRFKSWKLSKPWWLQLLIELPVYVLIFWLLNLVFNSFGYSVSFW